MLGRLGSGPYVEEMFGAGDIGRAPITEAELARMNHLAPSILARESAITRRHRSTKHARSSSSLRQKIASVSGNG
jgi:hypothetical protein